MKADCPRALESCTIKLASRTPGQRGWSELQKRQGLPQGKHMPGSSQGGARQARVGVRRQASGHSTAFLGKLLCSKAAPAALGCSNREEQWLQVGLRPGTQHRCVLGSPLLAVLCCHQERQKLCACRNCFGLVMLVLQSDSAQSLCLAFREDLP